MSRIAALTLTFAAAALASGSAALAAGPAPLQPYASEFPAESKSRAACEAVEGRLFVATATGSECIAYFVTEGHEKKRHAVIFLDGDVSLEKYNEPGLRAKVLAGKHKFMQSWSERSGQRFVDISRVGVNGSSGNHGNRRKPHETVIMNAAIDLLKQKLGLDTVTLAGQSGGSTIAASILTFGRRDVTCAVLGSGAYELVDLEHRFRTGKGFKVTREALAKVMYDPSEHVAAIETNARRRIFVVGDTADTKTPFDQQVRFAEAIRAGGHHARVYPIDAGGETDHDAARMTIPIAGACARGDSDEVIQRGIPKKKPAATAKAAETKVTSAQDSPGARLR